MLCCSSERAGIRSPVVRAKLAASPCVMSDEAGGILDTTNTIGIHNFDGSDANWKGWRVKFEAYADLANI